LSTDKYGNIYALAWMAAPVSFGSATVGVKGYKGAIVLKLSSMGQLLWTRTLLTNSGSISPSDLAVDIAGNVYIVGDFRGKLTAGATTLFLPTWKNSDLIFIIKLTPKGAVLWAKQAGHDGQSKWNWAANVTVNNVGTVYFTGASYNGGLFGSTKIVKNTTPSLRTGFVASIDGAGKFIWVNAIQGNSKSGTASVELDAQGSLRHTGYFAGVAKFGNGLTLTTKTTNISRHYMAKMTSFGSNVWVKDTGSYANASAMTSLALDGQSNTYLARPGAIVSYDTNGKLRLKYTFCTEKGKPNSWHLSKGFGKSLLFAGNISPAGGGGNIKCGIKNIQYPDAYSYKVDYSGTLQWLSVLSGANILLKDIGLSGKNPVIIGEADGKAILGSTVVNLPTSLGNLFVWKRSQ